MKKQFLVLAALLTVYGCATVIPTFAPKKTGRLSETPTALQADKYFWDNFHAGNYDSIPQILDRLTAAYLENNRDYKIAAHLGFTHAWALAESGRVKNVSPRVTDHATLAVKYFDEAFALHPEKEWRYYGFLVSMSMAEGGIHGDMQDMTEGYFKMKKAVRKYPEFNLFTAAYTLAMSPRKKDREAAVDMLWKNIDKCAGEKVSRTDLDYRKYMAQKTTEGKMSTCWNTWIAPHNMEGFLMITGDLVLRKGDYETALLLYKNAQYFEEYAHWDYREHLESRIKSAENALLSGQKFAEMSLPDFDRCMVCHQDRKMRPAAADVHVRLPNLEVSAHY